MKTNIFFFLIIVFFFSCKKEETNTTLKPTEHLTSRVLVLKIDFVSNQLIAAKELAFDTNLSDYSLITEYDPPNDIGFIRVKIKETQALLFDGFLDFLSTGEIRFPTDFVTAYHFQNATSTTFAAPKNGFENIFNPQKKQYDYNYLWQAIENKKIVQEYLTSNPNMTVNLFLYEFDYEPIWIVFLKK